jgi:hypothetical protein
LPLALFRLFVSPWICGIDAEDGRRSIRRSYTPAEWKRITAKALAGSDGAFRVSVAPLYIRQVVDISYDQRAWENRRETDDSIAEGQWVR